MKLVTLILLYYLPWLCYAYLISQNGVLAMLAYLLILVALSLSKIKPKFLIPLGHLSGILLLLFLMLIKPHLRIHPWLIVSGVLCCIILASILLRKKFSLHYRRLGIAAENGQQSIFLALNYCVLGVWAIYFALMLIFNLVKFLYGYNSMWISNLLGSVFSS